MNVFGAIVTFSVVWWLIFFMALPFGVRPQSDLVPGADPGAPERPRLWIKALVTTVLAAVITAIIGYVIEQEFISMRP